jgi:hypothetical protein
MITRWRGVLLACAAAALVLTAAACGDDDADSTSADSSSSAQQGDVDAITARVQRNEVLLALKAIGDLPLHDMDVAINEGEAGSRDLPNARTAVRYLALSDWPAELEGDVATLQEAAAALVRALDEGDIEAAKQPATDLHEGWHDFSNEAWAAVAGGLPAEAGIESSHEEESETPVAGGTAATGDNHSE